MSATKMITNKDGDKAYFLKLNKAKCLQLIKNAPEFQRDSKSANLKKIKTAIKASNWMFNGQTIVLDKSGRLLDGLHRLKTFVSTSFYPEVLVSQLHWDDDDAIKAYNTTDQGSPKRLTDMFKSEKIKYYAQVSSISQQCLNLLDGDCMFSSGRDAQSCLDFYRKYEEDIQTALAASGKIKTLVGNSVPISTTIFWMIYNGYGDFAIEFVERMGSLRGLSQNQTTYSKILMSDMRKLRGKLTAKEHTKMFMFFLRHEIQGTKGTSNTVSKDMGSKTHADMANDLIKAANKHL